MSHSRLSGAIKLFSLSSSSRQAAQVSTARALRLPGHYHYGCRPLSTSLSLKSTDPPSETSQSQDADAQTSFAQASPDEDAQSAEFASMKGIITYDLWKAITVRPFKHTTMSPVQQAVLRLLPDLAGPVKPEDHPSSQDAPEPKDLLVKARTGTGKTLAFLVPAIQARIRELNIISKGVPGIIPKAIAGQNRRDHSKNTAGVLILSPTRELATQIAAESDKLSTHVKEFNTQLFVGGASKSAQIKSFMRGRKDVIVATPGRLLDMLQDPAARVAPALENVRTVIFDEADTLLDMGFKDEIDRILEFLPPKTQRQTFLFSATVSSEIKRIAEKSLKPDHLFIDCVPKNEINVHQHIPQYVTVLPTASAQLSHLVRLLMHDALTNPKFGKVIIFLPTTKLTQLVAQTLISLKPLMPQPKATTIQEIHSQLTQMRRDRTSDRFRRASHGFNVLVTSDVSARGVDYPGVTRVIQLGMPTSADSYVHRVGRTGRAGQNGRADLVLLPFEGNVIHTALRKFPLQPLTVADLQEETLALAQSAGAGNIENHLENLDEVVTSRAMENFDDEELRDVFMSMIGFYMGRTADIGGSKLDILHGLQQWSTEVAGMTEPPHISPTMMAKMGLTKELRGPKRQNRDRFDRRGGSRGPRDFDRGSRDFGRGPRDFDRGPRDFGRGPRRDSDRSPPWAQRGSSRSSSRRN